MRKAVFIRRVSTWVWAENAGFTHKKAGKDIFALHFFSARAHTPCPRRMFHALGAWNVP